MIIMITSPDPPSLYFCHRPLFLPLRVDCLLYRHPGYDHDDDDDADGEHDGNDADDDGEHDFNGVDDDIDEGHDDHCNPPA